MSYHTRLKKCFEGACRLPLLPQSKYVLFSDCHRGIGNSNDNFLKNKPLFQAALQFYYRNHFTYIELGDGDELWENREMKQILKYHSDIFEQLTLFHKQDRLYMLYGNHDIVKRLPDIFIHQAIILENHSNRPFEDIYLIHGHQVDFLNSTLWRLSCFLVRHLWKPLEHFGVSDPTSAAKNYKRKEKTEQRLQTFARRENHLLIAGHTHRPYLSATDPYYCNIGSCVHPFSITCLEIERLNLTLVKWTLSVGADMHLVVAREVLAGPVNLSS